MPDEFPEGRSPRWAPPFFFSLKTKFIAALILLVSAVLGLSGWWNFEVHRGHMLQATEDRVRAMAEALDRGIQFAMREGHTPRVQQIIDNAARDPDIDQIMILDDRGRIVRASKPDLVGRTLARDRLSRYLVQADAGAVRVIADELPAADPRKEIMEEILDQVHRLDKTVKDLLIFARPPTPSLAPCDVHQVLDRVLILLADDLAAIAVRIVRAYAPDTPQLEADGKQLGQVFLNLLLNAAQAMPDGGQVTLRTGLYAGNGADAEPWGPGGQAVEVRVSDNGPGMPAHVVSNIFTPFFTTKSRGAGLGLSISRRIVEDHGGRIAVESAPGEGTTFRVVLPVRAADGRGGMRP
jgi:signal transduction histidine kinase